MNKFTSFVKANENEKTEEKNIKFSKPVPHLCLIEIALYAWKFIVKRRRLCVCSEETKASVLPRDTTLGTHKNITQNQADFNNSKQDTHRRHQKRQKRKKEKKNFCQKCTTSTNYNHRGVFWLFCLFCLVCIVMVKCDVRSCITFAYSILLPV